MASLKKPSPHLKARVSKLVKEVENLIENMKRLFAALNNQSLLLKSFVVQIEALKEKAGITDEEINATAKKLAANAGNAANSSEENCPQSEERPNDEGSSGPSKLRVLRDESDDAGTRS